VKAYINAHKVLELSAWDLDTIRELGFQGIRFDITTADEVEPSCERLIEYDLEGILLINGGGMPLSHDETVNLAAEAADMAGGDVAFEIGNEPDLTRYGDDWDGFGALVNDAWKVIGGRFPVISGGVFSTTARGLEYLAYAMRWMDPRIAIGIHSYRQNGTPERQHTPWGSRDGELLMIKALASPRPVWCTEMGWHTAPYPTGLFGWFEKRWRDEEILDFLVQELRLQAQHGVEVTVVYQWTDGPEAGREGIDSFGMKHYAEAALKPQAQCVKISEL
jgi:hypothetical protein